MQLGTKEANKPFSTEIQNEHQCFETKSNNLTKRILEEEFQEVKKIGFCMQPKHKNKFGCKEI